MPSAFPQEIYEEVIQHLQDDRAALSATALTCYSLLATSQKHLFARIVLYPSFPKKGATSAQFERLLSLSPHIGAYVEYLELHVCADRHQWAGWTPSLEFCLPHLSQLRALVLRVDQSPPWSGGFTTRAPEDRKGADGIMQALMHTVQLPSLVSLDTYCLDISPLFHQCRYIKELKLSKPIMPVASNNPAATIPALVHSVDDGSLIFLETLRLETSFESDDNAMIRPTLYSQGILLTKLKRLSMVSCGFGRDLFMRELWDISEACGDTLEELEIQAHFTIRDLNSLDWMKSNLPSLRALHLHFYRIKSSSPHDSPTFINTFADLLHHLPCSPSSSSYSDLYTNGSFHTNALLSPLEHLIFNDCCCCCSGPDHSPDDPLFADGYPLIIQILSDRTRFPRFQKLSWYACSHVTNYLRTQAFDDVNKTPPFVVEFELGFP